jgi:hypothetical protein
VGLDVRFAGPLVAVGTTPVPVGRVAVKSIGVVTPPCVGVIVCVSVAGTTGDGDVTGTVGVSLMEGEGSVG